MGGRVEGWGGVLSQRLIRSPEVENAPLFWAHSDGADATSVGPCSVTTTTAAASTFLWKHKQDVVNLQTSFVITLCWKVIILFQ